MNKAMKEDYLEDRIERFIRQNRGKFDDQEPTSELWQRIDGRLPNAPKAKQAQLVYWRAAAVVFFAITLGLLVKNNITTTPSTNINDPEFAQTEDFYSDQIKDKEQLIQVFLIDHPSLGEEFRKDLEELDRNYLRLKEEYQMNNSEIILDALILNLQSRIELLNKQLTVVRSINEQEDEINI